MIGLSSTTTSESFVTKVTTQRGHSNKIGVLKVVYITES